jgi:hypothetical protein
VCITAAAEPDDLATNGIFLISEFERDKVGCSEAVERNRGCTVSLCADEELDVLEAEWRIFSSGGYVLVRPHEKEEANDYHLSHGKGLNMTLVDGQTGGVVQDLDWYGIYPGRRVVALGIAAQLASYYSEVGLTFGIVPGVRGSHAHHGLRHRTEGSFHCARAAASAAGSNLARAIVVGKDLKEIDWVPSSVSHRLMYRSRQNNRQRSQDDGVGS